MSGLLLYNNLIYRTRLFGNTSGRFKKYPSKKQGEKNSYVNFFFPEHLSSLGGWHGKRGTSAFKFLLYFGRKYVHILFCQQFFSLFLRINDGINPEEKRLGLFFFGMSHGWRVFRPYHENSSFFPLDSYVTLNCLFTQNSRNAVF